MIGFGLTVALVATGVWAFLIGVIDIIRDEQQP